MSPTNELEEIVALVVLRPGSGRKITGESLITTDTLRHYLPDPRDAVSVGRTLTDAGFQVGSVVGVGMSLTGSRALFERFFAMTVREADDGGWVAVDRTGETTRELPLVALPPALSQRVQAVCFEPPAELVDEEMCQ